MRGLPPRNMLKELNIRQAVHPQRLLPGVVAQVNPLAAAEMNRRLP